MAVETSQREREIHNIWKNYKFFYQISGSILLIILATLIGRSLFPNDEGYWSNVYMTALGVLITILVLDRLAEQREEQREIKALKQQLLRDVRSTSNEVAKNGVHQMREHGWLEGKDGLLRGVDLHHSNLQGANFVDANLEGANFWLAKLQGAHLAGANLQGALLNSANLEKADLWEANLQEAKLVGANLRSAVLAGVNLQGADLRGANLQDAVLVRAKLQGAMLTNANLQGAYLLDAKFNETTILPDGNKWTLETDIIEFGTFLKDPLWE